MLSKLRPHLTYANVVSSVCLFVVLGGTAYAATVITGKNVKDGSLTGKDVKNSSLTGGDVKNESLTPKDFNGSVQGPKGDTGPQGPAGPSTGPAGGDLTGTYPNPLIGAGKVGSVQLTDGAVTPAKLAPGIQAARINFDQAPDFTAGGIGDAPVHPLASVNGLAMTTRCIQFSVNPSITVGYVYLNPSAGANVNWLLARKFSAGGSADQVDINGVSIPAAEYEVARVGGGSGLSAPQRVEGQIVVRSGSQVTTVAFHAFAVAGAGGNCQVYGTMTPGA